MRRLALAILIALPLCAQQATKPTTAEYIDQLAPRATLASGNWVLAIVGGRVLALTLGSGFSLNASTLSVAASASGTPVVGEWYQIETPPAAPTLTLAFTPLNALAACYRNGMRLTENVDYTVAANVVTFAPAHAPQAGDVYTFDYSH